MRVSQYTGELALQRGDKDDEATHLFPAGRGCLPNGDCRRSLLSMLRRLAGLIPCKGTISYLHNGRVAADLVASGST